MPSNTMRAGKVRYQTPFISSKNVSHAEIKRKLNIDPEEPPQYFSRLDWRVYENQEHREKKKTGRSKKRNQFNIKIKSSQNEENYKEEQFHSLAFPIMRREENYLIYESPNKKLSVNSIQRQF